VHTYLLVAGDPVDEQLSAFSVHAEVAPYEVFLSDADIASMAEHYGVPSADLGTLAAKMQDWQRAEGFIRDGRLGYLSTDNPDGRHDWYKVGGQWADALRLREPRPLRRFFGLLPAGRTSRATSAKKSEIDQEALLADPPAALLFRGEWLASPFFAEGEAEAGWRAQFAQHFARIPDDTVLTVVDTHS
jgi:hypothetical protein